MIDDGTGATGPGREPWWDGAVGYEVYVRSFADSNGNGTGDLPGLEAHLEYLAWLGVGIVWITQQSIGFCSEVTGMRFCRWIKGQPWPQGVMRSIFRNANTTRHNLMKL